MKLLSKLLALLLCLFLLLGLCPPTALAAESAADGTVIHIRTADDLADLAKLCALDSWSRGKTFLLERNIDLSHIEFTAIPTFGGTFDGQGHTITGLKLSVLSDTCGLFRYIQSCGVVKNLFVDGSITPKTTKNILGGIVGSNAGTIQNCQFRGNIIGFSTAGGIAGTNEASGQIINCSFSGSVSGEHYIGGIAGQNHGSIVRCENTGNVNITEISPSLDQDRIDLDYLSSTEAAPATTDIGGIAGFSSGIIQSCLNSGPVGYPHTGYNIGGIVGRQTGYLDSCINKGLIQGRKDVGGIAGQMEPQLMLKYDQNTLDRIWTELDTLEAMIDGFLENTSGTAVQLTDKIQGVSDSAATVKNAVTDLSGAFTDWADGNIHHINDASARISWVLERMVPVVDQVESALDLMEQAVDQFSEGLSQSSVAAKFGSEATSEMSLAMSDIQNSAPALRQAVSHFREAIDLLEQSLGNTAVTKRALTDMAAAVEDMTSAFTLITLGLSQLYESMDRVYTWIQTDPNWNKLRDGVGQLRDALGLVLDSMHDISDALEKIINDEDFSEGISLLFSAAKGLAASMEHLNLATEDLLAAYEEFQQDASSPAVQEHLNNAVSDLTDAQEDMTQALADMRNGLELIENSDAILTYLPKLQGYLSDLTDALDAAGTAVDTINEALDELEQSNVPDTETTAIRSALDLIIAGLNNATGAARELSSAFSALANNSDPAALEAALKKVSAALSALEDVISDIEPSMGHLKSAADKLSAAADELAAALDTFSQAGSALSDSIGQMEQAAADIGAILEELTQMPDIQFDDLDSAITDEGDILNTAADRFLTSFNTLNAELRTQSDLLTDDLQAINAQVGVITDLLHLLQQEQTEKESGDLLDDVSDQDSGDSITNGKISACENSGMVDGDLNIAGIVGSIAIEYDFDPEDDLTVKGTRNLDFAFLARTVVLGCVNRGSITAKKSCAGGITGQMELGRVSGCQSYGSVVSSNGSYVGGIAGESYGSIVNCWAKCSLSGNGYVGGIAGLGSLIQGCRTLIDADNNIPFTGAIAGQLTEDGTLENNLFVHHALAGVDGISYESVAQPLAYEAFCALEGIPAEITSFELIFMADGKVVATVPFRYGDSLTQLPDIPEKAAHSARWPERDYSRLTFSYVLEAEYTPYDTALSDGQPLPAFLVDGSFSPDAEVTITEQKTDWSDGKEVTAYTVTVTDKQAAQVFYTLHWRLPDQGKYDLWLLNGSEWIHQSYTPDGSYLLLECVGESVTFVLTEQETPVILLCGLLLAAAAVITVTVILIVKHSKKKRKLQNTAAGKTE